MSPVAIVPDHVLAAAAGLAAKVTLLLLTAALLTLILRRRSAALRALIWNSSIAVAVALPLAALAVPDWYLRFGSTELTPQLVRREAVRADSAAALLAAQRSPSARPGRVALPDEISGETQHPPGVTQATTLARAPQLLRIVSPWLAILWLAGSLMACARFAAQLAARRDLRRTMQPVTFADANHELTSCARMLGVRRPVRLLMSANIAVPIAAGVLHPAVVLPAAALEWQPQQLRSVLLHELAHLKRLDPLWLVLSRFMLVLYWWHPLAWLAARYSYLETERACDNSVLVNGRTAQEYAAHLVSVARSAVSAPAPIGYQASMARGGYLDGRVRALFDKRVRREPVRLPAALLLSFTAAAVLGAMAGCEVRNGDNVNVVRNTTRAWGDAPRVRLEKVREYGSRAATDSNFTLYLPRDVEVDASGNTYIFDFGNRRIQKYSPEGKYLQTIGRAGEGPGELDNPWSFGLDANGRILVLSQTHLQIFGPDGAEVERHTFENPIQDGYVAIGGTRIVQLPNGLWQDRPGFDLAAESAQPLINIFDLSGRLLRSLGATEQFDFDGKVGVIRSVFLDHDSRDNIWLSYGYANRVEKYSPEGNLLVAADYPLSVEQYRNIDVQPDFWIYQLGKVSEGIQVDGRDRVWVQSYREQITWSLYSSRSKWDKPYFVLNVFDSTGALQGTLPMDQVFYSFRIFEDRLFLVDRMGMMTVTEYRIVS